jgi:magnesium transporter
MVEQKLNDPVTEHMRTDFARLSVDQTIAQALAAIRSEPPEGRIIYFYVLDEENRLMGVVPTRRLLLNPAETPVREIMVLDVITIPRSATVFDACEFFVFHRLLAFPVVDEENKLVGVVDVELYTDELRDLDRAEGDDDLFQLIGVHLIDSRQSSPPAAFVSRFPWLLANIVGGILAALLAGVFEQELQRTVALALFIPVVLALAESVSIQSVSLTLQTLHARKPTMRAILEKIRLEVVTGLFLGMVSGLVVATAAFIWLGHVRVMLCLLGGIAGGVTCAAVIGVAMPSLLKLSRRDPQVAAGPIALASTDMITLLVYFTLARWLLV